MDLFRKSKFNDEPERLTSTPLNEDEPNIAPDGQTLAFVRMHRDFYSLIVLSLNGTRQERELGRAAEYRSISWSSDGNLLAVAEFSTHSGETRLRAVNVKTGEWRTILDEGFSDDNGSISPTDANWLLSASGRRHRQTFSL